jgi:hypothetical protein
MKIPWLNWVYPVQTYCRQEGGFSCAYEVTAGINRGRYIKWVKGINKKKNWSVGKEEFKLFELTQLVVLQLPTTQLVAPLPPAVDPFLSAVGYDADEPIRDTRLSMRDRDGRRRWSPLTLNRSPRRWLRGGATGTDARRRDPAHFLRRPCRRR